MELKKLLPIIFSGGKSVAKLTATLTGAATLTIATMTVATGKTVTVDWGDGSTNDYTAGTGARTHAYAGAGTYTVKISPPGDITALTLSDNKITLNSADIKKCVNLTSFSANAMKGGRFDTADVAAWTQITTFGLYEMPAGYAGTFNFSDISAWRPTFFNIYSVAGLVVTFSSANVSAWRPTTFRLYTVSASSTFTFPAGGFAGWITPTIFSMSGNALLTAQVDQILADFWTAFPTKTATNGTLGVGGTNQAPTGAVHAENPPTDGGSYAYELVNDTGGVSLKHWATVTVTA
jgi:hypothetical protein